MTKFIRHIYKAEIWYLTQINFVSVS